RGLEGNPILNCISTRSRVYPERVLMHSNQSWPPAISPLGVHPCFRNATRVKQGCCRDWQGHTVFVSIIDERGARALRPASLAVESDSNSNAAVLMLPNKG